MSGTRWRRLLREAAGNIHRELLITITPAPRPKAWVFVVGCYNSGTTLLAQMLGEHPRISALPTEGQFLTDQLPADYDYGIPRMWVMREDLWRLTEDDAGPDVTRLKKEWAIRLDTKRDFLLEKSPPNAARTRWLQKHFENAHFIAIVRNGYAVAQGIRRKAEPRHLREGWPIEACATQWARSNEILLEDSTRLNKVLWVTYEDLTEAPARELGRMFSFLGVDPAEMPAAGTKSYRVHEREEKVGNLNAASIARLSPDDIAAVTRIAKPMLKRFGYDVLGEDDRPRA